jgi:hypothetical protein
MGKRLLPGAGSYYSTVKLPVIHGWKVQWYAKVPGVSGVKLKVA